MFGMKQLTWEAIIHTVRSLEPALCLPSFRPPAPDTSASPAVATSQRSRCRGPAPSWPRPSRPCAFCNFMPLTPTCPSGPREHTPLTSWWLAHLQARRDVETSRPSRPHNLTPLMPLTPIMALTLLVPLMPTCCLAHQPLLPGRLHNLTWHLWVRQEEAPV